uniref:Outer membrane protein A n=1 Tax=Avibacterium paragallinarum TaxID=728 RepID=A0A060IGD8_AVIPA|nr:haemagglutinin [Avibacterium paragallinarum]
MKKTAIALAIAGLTAAAVAQAAPQANTFYAGAKAGWASFHDGLNQFENSQNAYGTLRNSVTYGVFGGYQITDNFAVELGYDDFGRAKLRKGGETVIKHTNHGAHLSLKASYPVLEGLDVYARVGAALIRSDYKSTKRAESDYVMHEHSLKVSPVFAGGLEYNLPSLPELALRVEYQWVNKVGRVEKDGSRVDYTPSIGSVTAGLSYRFGQSAPVVEPKVVAKTFALNSDVTFAFGKANLRPEAQNVLDGIYGEIAQLKSVQVDVAGYTDRIGSEAANLKLSQRRADTVANYLVSKGVAQEVISSTGYGEANPVIGAKCDAVKGRKALIAWLADDRRVEISVKGNE